MTTSALAGPEKRPWQNRQSCQPIEQVLGHPLFFLRLPANAFPDIWKANTHGKTKAILFLQGSIWFCRDVFVLAVRFLVLPWQLWATIPHQLQTPLPAEFHTTRHLEAWHSSLGAHLPCRWSRFDYKLSCFFLFVVFFFCFRFVCFFKSYFSRFACFPLFSLLVHYSEVFAINVFLVMLI